MLHSKTKQKLSLLKIELQVLRPFLILALFNRLQTVKIKFWKVLYKNFQSEITFHGMKKGQFSIEKLDPIQTAYLWIIVLSAAYWIW